jgi:hypothetical protein
MPQKNNRFENMDLIGVLTPLPRSLMYYLRIFGRVKHYLRLHPVATAAIVAKIAKRILATALWDQKMFLPFLGLLGT